MAFGIYDAADFGAPQNRVRLLLAPPVLIRRLNETPACERVSMAQGLHAAGVAVPQGATHVKNSSWSNGSANVRPLTAPAFTCCASRALTFCTATGRTVLSMRPEHTRALMGLLGFKLSGVQRVDQRVLGNGMCAGFTRAICSAAMGENLPECESMETRLLCLERRLTAVETKLDRRSTHPL